MKEFAKVVIIIFISMLAGASVHRCCDSTDDVVVQQVIDTVTIVDTVVHVEPQIVAIHNAGKRKLRVSKDAVVSPTEEELLTDDSVTVMLDAEQMVYEDSDYRAYISGIAVRLDSMYLFPRREIITIREPPNRWHIGPMIGVGVSSRGRVEVVAGVSVSYSFYSF